MFLDEPTIGLDVVSQKIVREFLREHNAREKTTILLTSHYMGDIQELCERVIIIDHGSIFFDGRLSEVVDRFADSKLITIQCEAGVSCPPAVLETHGDIMENSAARVQLKVKRGPGDPGVQSPARRVAGERYRYPGSAHRGNHPPPLRPEPVPLTNRPERNLLLGISALTASATPPTAAEPHLPRPHLGQFKLALCPGQ